MESRLFFGHCRLYHLRSFCLCWLPSPNVFWRKHDWYVSAWRRQIVIVLFQSQNLLKMHKPGNPNRPDMETNLLQPSSPPLQQNTSTCIPLPLMPQANLEQYTETSQSFSPKESIHTSDPLFCHRRRSTIPHRPTSLRISQNSWKHIRAMTLNKWSYLKD